MSRKEILKELASSSATLKAMLSYIRYSRETRAKLFNVSNRDGTGAVFFTTPKCASTFVAQTLSLIERESSNVKTYNYEGLYWNTGHTDVYRSINRDAERLFSKSTAIYGPLRHYVEVPGIENRPVVLMLRDPRDAVLSSYYSVAFSHSLPGGRQARKNYIARREHAKSLSPDEYVAYALTEYLPKYEIYAEKILGLKNVTFISYEEMIHDIELWARRFIEGLGLTASDGLVTKIKAAYLSGKPDESSIETVENHRRNGAHGQFKEKLKPETVELLNREFSDIIREFSHWHKYWDIN